MEEARLAILEAEINKQQKEIEKIYSRIKERARNLNIDFKVESLAYQLHNLYCAYLPNFSSETIEKLYLQSYKSYVALLDADNKIIEIEAKRQFYNSRIIILSFYAEKTS